MTEKQVVALEAALAAAASKDLFKGEGELSHELIARELLDPQRFKNPRQVGNYFGLCPSESSSGEKRRLGAITKHGSPRLRRLLIHLAWRVVIFQPAYRGMQRWGSVLGLEAAKSSGAAAQESHRGAGAATGRGSVADRHRPGQSRRARAGPAVGRVSKP